MITAACSSRSQYSSSTAQRNNKSISAQRPTSVTSCPEKKHKNVTKATNPSSSAPNSSSRSKITKTTSKQNRATSGKPVPNSIPPNHVTIQPNSEQSSNPTIPHAQHYNSPHLHDNQNQDKITNYDNLHQEHRSESHVTMLIAENQQLHQELFNKTRQYSETLSRCNQLFQAMESQKDFMNQIERSIQLLQEQHLTKDMELKSIREQNKVLLEEKDSYKEQLDRVKSERDRAIEKDQNLERKMIHLSSEYTKSQNQNRQHEGTIRNLEDKIRKQDHTISQSNMRISEMEYEVRQCVEKMRAFGHLKSENALLSRKLAKYEDATGARILPDDPRSSDSVHTLKEENSRLERELQDAKNSLQTLRVDFSEYQRAKEDIIHKLNSRIRQYEKDITDLKERHEIAVRAATQATEAAVSANVLAESSWMINDDKMNDRIPFHSSLSNVFSRSQRRIEGADDQDIGVWDRTSQSRPMSPPQTKDMGNKIHSSIARRFDDDEPTVLFLEKEVMQSNRILDNFSDRIQQLELEFK